jgi:hypothetical protein
MGYHVRIDEQSQALLEKLTLEPGKVFGRPYSGYLLFLVTQHDRQQLDWVVGNAAGLDSLTGQYLAYAVFAKSFPIKFRTDASRGIVENMLGERATQASKNEIPPELLKRPREVARLVENGAFGVVLDGDELTAITYGTDLVARELGLLDKLPCLVVLDAVPAQSPQVIPLTPQLLPKLIHHLRGALKRFYAVDGHTTILRDAGEIIKLQGCIDAELTRDATLRKRVADLQKKLVQLKQKAMSGSSTKDPLFFKDLAERQEADLALYERDLLAFPKDHPAKLAELESELAKAMALHQTHRHKTFSHCLSAELREAGLLEGVNVAKSQSMSFLSSIFKPDTLLKLWAFVH